MSTTFGTSPSHKRVFLFYGGPPIACWISGGSVRKIEVYENEGGVTSYTGGCRILVSLRDSSRFRHWIIDHLNLRATFDSTGYSSGLCWRSVLGRGLCGLVRRSASWLEDLCWLGHIVFADLILVCYFKNGIWNNTRCMSNHIALILCPLLLQYQSEQSGGLHQSFLLRCIRSCNLH